MAARRTAATGTSKAAARPSWTAASIAPCRSSPNTKPRSRSCSSAVARASKASTAAARAAVDPAPLRLATYAKTASTSPTVSEASAGRRRYGLQRLPAHPRTPLAQAPRQVGDDDLDVITRSLPKHCGDEVTLGVPRARAGERDSRLGKSAQQHAGDSPSWHGQISRPVRGFSSSMNARAALPFGRAPLLLGNNSGLFVGLVGLVRFARLRRPPRRRSHRLVAPAPRWRPRAHSFPQRASLPDSAQSASRLQRQQRPQAQRAAAGCRRRSGQRPPELTWPPPSWREPSSPEQRSWRSPSCSPRPIP